MLVNGLLNYVTLALWGLIALYVMVSLFNNVPRLGLRRAIQRLFSRVFFIVLLAVTAIWAVTQSIVFIEPQEAAIVISLLSPEGYQDRPLHSGLHWIAPLLESVYRYPIAWQTYTMSAKPSEGQSFGNDAIVARTQDGQEVLIDCSIIYRIDVEQVIRVHIDWQERYVSDFIRPVIRSTVRNLASQYTVDEINSSKRTSLENDLNNLLSNALRDKGFVMDSFLLRNVSFTPEYAAAVERKQVAQQDVIQNQYQATQIVVIALAQSDAVRKKAAADADALQLLSDVLAKNPLLLTYRYIEKLAPNISVMLVPNNAPFILPFPTTQAMQTAPSPATGNTNTSLFATTTPYPAATAIPLAHPAVVNP